MDRMNAEQVRKLVPRGSGNYDFVGGRKQTFLLKNDVGLVPFYATMLIKEIEQCTWLKFRIISLNFDKLTSNQ